MNTELMKFAGFQQEVKAVEKGLCPICRNKIDMKDFRTDLDRKEFRISGMCQKCIDICFES